MSMTVKSVTQVTDVQSSLKMRFFNFGLLGYDIIYSNRWVSLMEHPPSFSNVSW